MSHPHRTRLIALTITTLAIVLAACADPPATPDVTEEPAAEEPDLVSFDAGTFGFTDFSGGTEKSFGIFVCVTDEEVVLESVEAMASEGQIEILGAFLFEARDGFVGAVNGFPPSGLSEAAVVQIPGAAVVTTCDAETRSQVVIGVDRTGAGGGRIDGVRIDYAGGSLEVADYNIVLCGDSMEFCEEVESGA